MLDTGPNFPCKWCHKHGLNCIHQSDCCLSPLAHRLSTPHDVCSFMDLSIENPNVLASLSLTILEVVNALPIGTFTYNEQHNRGNLAVAVSKLPSQYIDILLQLNLCPKSQHKRSN